MIFLFPRWDMLVLWMVYNVANLTSSRHGLPSCPSNLDPTEPHQKPSKTTPFPFPPQKKTHTHKIDDFKPGTPVSQPVTSMDGNHVIWTTHFAFVMIWFIIQLKQLFKTG